MPDAERVYLTTCLNNCGARCALYVHMRGGAITDVTTETTRADGGIPLTACPKGPASARHFLGKDRLLTPLRRVGARGEGRFEPIGWNDALAEIAEALTRAKARYGAGSRFVHYGCGDSGLMNGTAFAKRLLALDGGYLDYYNNYSNPCLNAAAELMYGTTQTGNSPETWLKSRLIILWGHNPAATRFDAPTMYYLRRARDAGIPIVVVDPRRSETVRALGAQWLPLRPGTDAALMDAMAYVIARDGLTDRAFLDRCCVGYDAQHMPKGARGGSVFDYLTGACDGVPKTPEWAEAITGVPAGQIEEFARRYAAAKPAALIMGYGAQRTAAGEQTARGGILLCCMTGNVGVPGGWACGSGSAYRHALPTLPKMRNPYARAIPVFRWTEAVERGREMGAAEGVRGGRLDSDIRLIMNLAGNCLVNQHADINRTTALLRDTRKCEFIVCSDLFMTPSARFADILLPGVSMFECDDLTFPWKYGDALFGVRKLVEPLGACRKEYDWLRDLAAMMGHEPSFSEGRDAMGWLRFCYDRLRRRETDLPDYDTFREQGVFRYPDAPPLIAFEHQAADPAAHPFATKSGRIELYSADVPDGVPNIPRYVPTDEGYGSARAERYPLQLIGRHTIRRSHSVFDNCAELRRLDPQRFEMHPVDAAARGIGQGDVVRVFNDRGALTAPVDITENVLPGVVSLAQGAWYDPDPDGTDRAASVNVLTSLTPTPLAHGNAQHSNLVEVRKEFGV